ncbi:uncharacterized protein BDR25DRAFT_342015 [Lindgomyces ingoldianus]|uniref:Uncharacterized protein n=1 Tax=Lindgomyces ingoldianus TaxID=673940 RepID=A0ACB6QYU5_9PLEO|nr:uncharacterized protein BDR25DRAFT_342015 [Lindgomyces ingoldianus]KAF2471962.1 hypothetical protein BDR25DRAFT_342015 [Lindgomyces ingoldianus]
MLTALGRTTILPVTPKKVCTVMRVIQDSEDELDEDVESPVGSPPTKDASFEPTSTSLTPCEPGTVSTGYLNRTIEASNLARFQSEPMLSIGSGEPFKNGPVSPRIAPEHRSKRRKTTMNASPSKSLGSDSERKKPLKLYGRSKSALNSSFHERSQNWHPLNNVEMPTDGSLPLISSAAEESQFCLGKAVEVLEYPRNNADPNGTQCGIEGTIRANHEAHDPMTLFPETSSTIPNATFTQQRLLDEVISPAFLGLNPEVDMIPYEPGKSSIPWSDYLKTPLLTPGEGDTEGDSDPDHTQNLPQSSFQPHNDHQPHSRDADMKKVPQGLQSTNASLCSRRNSSVQMKASPLRNAIIQETRSSHVIFDHNANCGSPAPYIAVERAALTNPSKAEQNPGWMPKSKDDLLTVGLPEEKYKARPTRSISLTPGIEEPINYSILPEKGAMKGAKRSKTFGEVHIPADDLTPRQVQEICEIGFTPSTIEMDLKENGSDVHRTLDRLVTNEDAYDEDELALPRSSKAVARAQKSNSKAMERVIGAELTVDEVLPLQRRGRRVSFSMTAPLELDHDKVPKEVITVDEMFHENSDILATSSLKITTSNAKSTKPNMSRSTDLLHDHQGQKAECRKIAPDQPGSALEEHKKLLSEPVKAKKRGRGRPRKEKVVSEEAIGQEENVEGPQDGLIERDTKIPSNRPATRDLPKLDEGEGRTETMSMSIPRLPACTPSPKTSTPALPVPSRTPEQQSKQASTAHSPLSKGKVPYRVGLSRRVRVAPLLRVVKK